MGKEVLSVFTFLLTEIDTNIWYRTHRLMDLIEFFAVNHFTYKPISFKIVWCILCYIVFRDKRDQISV